MARSPGALQDAFLNQCRKEGVRCIVYLVNGVQLRGVIRGFDSFTLLMEENNEQMIVYKHAITTVQPMRRLAEIREPADGEGAVPRPVEEPRPTE